ncbi:hypothetical protein PFUGPA_05124 [Plasmodium falciparum Palo Alto/Uganda]|uniref:Actin-related protein 2/3 complex subunit 1 n=1 Tax=Plasmodium falciparum (isolate Palo Alto / Uganda) TaxID=57270 RepID=W4IU14_PLAFP|nr:hypothetical protein PFUGPA_05124 [Plasmodium falciparum Palo Alto/Uganda]
MKCIIYKKKENGKWECTNVNIPTEDLPTCACWHPHTYSFAIGFTSGIIFICSKKENQKWKIKKINNHVASVMFIDWSSSANTQYVSWVGQTLQRCLFLDDDKLLVYGYEIFPIIVEYLNDEWIISKVVLPEFNIKNLTVDFFYDQKEIQEIEQECEHLDGNEIIGEIVAHSNYILQISMLEPYENKIYIEFITVSSDFSIVLWNFSI